MKPKVPLDQCLHLAKWSIGLQKPNKLHCVKEIRVVYDIGPSDTKDINKMSTTISQNLIHLEEKQNGHNIFPREGYMVIQQDDIDTQAGKGFYTPLYSYTLSAGL